MTTTLTAPVPRVFTPGWYPGLPMADYLAIDAASNSRMRSLRKSASHYKHERQTEEEQDVTRAMALGEAIHLALLEPALFEGRYVVLGQCTARKKGDGQACTNAGIMLVGGQSYCGVHGKGEAPDLDVITIPGTDMAAVIGARDKILAHPRASSFFRAPGKREVTGIWTDPDTGILCKMRLDLRLDDPWILPDLKSTPDASPGFFRRHIVNRGYHHKMAWYRRGSRALGDDVKEAAIIAAEVKVPYEPACYLLEVEQLDRLDKEADRLLHHLAACTAEDRWPGYSPEFIPVKLPEFGFEFEGTESNQNGGT